MEKKELLKNSVKTEKIACLKGEDKNKNVEIDVYSCLREKGITLIALVITIIVLLILAGVTISMVVGENGILTRSKQAKAENERQSIFEAIRLVASDYSIGALTGEQKTFLQCIHEVPNIENIEEIRVGEVTYTDKCYVLIMKEWYTAYSDGEIIKGRIVWDGNISDGLAQENGKYLISTGADLAYLANKVNEGNSFVGETFILTESIDLGARKDINGIWIKGAKEWTTIGIRDSEGNDVSIFSGTFDGQNNIIRGIYCDDKSKYAGIFGNSNGIIKNVEVKYNYASGYVAGALVGNNEGTIDNCRSTGVGITKLFSDGTCYGGLVAINRENGIIINSYNSGEIIIQGNYRNVDNLEWVDTTIGGITYLNLGKIENCYNSGNLTNSLNFEEETENENAINFSIAGIAYYNANIIEKTYNSGNIELKQSGDMSTQSYSGGIVVFNGGDSSFEGIIKECYNTGNVSSTGNAVYAYTGGILAYNQQDGIIRSCYNSGTITNNSEGYSLTGGISGQNIGTIDSCYNAGKIKGNAKGINQQGIEQGVEKGVRYGGINGNTYRKNDNTKIINCYNIGEFEINTDNDSEMNPIYIGGIIGYLAGGTVENCYYLDSTISGGINKSGVAKNTTDISGVAEKKTEAEMKSSSFIDLLNSEYFKFNENNFPVFIWQL